MVRRWIIWLLLGVMLLSGASYGVGAYFNQTHAPILSNESLLDLEAETLLKDPQYAFQFIRTAQADASYNCHGWTFRAGKRSVSDDEVAEWIKSPRYKPVTTFPHVGDIVIYFRNNDICHSGIVQAVSRNGIILVESKWGTLGRFLHRIDAPQVANRRLIFRRSWNETQNWSNRSVRKSAPSTTPEQDTQSTRSR